MPRAHDPASAGEVKCFGVVRSLQPQGAFFVEIDILDFLKCHPILHDSALI